MSEDDVLAAALALLAEFVDEEPMKWYSCYGISEFGQQCVFCEAPIVDSPHHAPDCLIVRAQALLTTHRY